MIRYTVLFLLITFINVIPAFVPATWTVISFLSVAYNIPFVPISIISAFAATLGRVILAHLSRTILREHFLKARTKRNLDVLENYLIERKHIGFIIFLTYAFSPFPSNQLFIAYGLTKLKLRYIAVPFLIGRLASYLFLTFATNKVADIFPEELSSVFGSYFIVVQLLTIASVYLFAKIDWKKLLRKKKVELIS